MPSKAIMASLNATSPPPMSAGRKSAPVPKSHEALVDALGNDRCKLDRELRMKRIFVPKAAECDPFTQVRSSMKLFTGTMRPLLRAGASMPAVPEKPSIGDKLRKVT